MRVSLFVYMLHSCITMCMCFILTTLLQKLVWNLINKVNNKADRVPFTERDRRLMTDASLNLSVLLRQSRWVDKQYLHYAYTINIMQVLCFYCVV